MTKADLIWRISSKAGVESKKVELIIGTFMDVVKENVANGEEVTLRGFGTFKNVLRKEKNFHYAPGKYKVIPEHYEVVLQYSNEVKEVVK